MGQSLPARAGAREARSSDINLTAAIIIESFNNRARPLADLSDPVLDGLERQLNVTKRFDLKSVTRFFVSKEPFYRNLGVGFSEELPLQDQLQIFESGSYRLMAPQTRAEVVKQLSRLQSKKLNSALQARLLVLEGLKENSAETKAILEVLAVMNTQKADTDGETPLTAVQLVKNFGIDSGVATQIANFSQVPLYLLNRIGIFVGEKNNKAVSAQFRRLPRELRIQELLDYATNEEFTSAESSVAKLSEFETVLDDVRIQDALLSIFPDRIQNPETKNTFETLRKKIDKIYGR